MTTLRRLWADLLGQVDTHLVAFILGLLLASLFCLAGTWLYGVSYLAGGAR